MDAGEEGTVTLLTEDLVERFRSSLRCGTVPAVARAKIRTALIREHGAGAVVEELPEINETLDRAQAEVLGDGNGPRPAA